jgi:hypothetical protein
MHSAQAPDSLEINLISNDFAGPVWRRRFDLVAAAWLLRSALPANAQAAGMSCLHCGGLSGKADDVKEGQLRGGTHGTRRDGTRKHRSMSTAMPDHVSIQLQIPVLFIR